MSVIENISNSEYSEVISNDNIKTIEEDSTDEEVIEYNIDDIIENDISEEHNIEDVVETETVKDETETVKDVVETETVEDVVETDIVEDVVETETTKDVVEIVNDIVEDVVETVNDFVEEDNEDDIYIITVNNIPYFYEKDLEAAEETVRKVAQIYCDNTNSYEIEYDEDEEELKVVQKVKLLFFTITTEKYGLKIVKVQKFDTCN